VLADTIDRVLSIIGAVGGISGLGGAWVAWRVYRRDRARLAFNWSISWPTGGEPSLDVVVVNDGRQPVSVESIFVTDAGPLVGRLGQTAIRVKAKVSRHSTADTLSLWRVRVAPAEALDAHLILEPSATVTLTFPLASLLALRHNRLHLVAVDSLGRQTTEELPNSVREAIDDCAEEQKG